MKVRMHARKAEAMKAMSPEKAFDLLSSIEREHKEIWHPASTLWQIIYALQAGHHSAIDTRCPGNLIDIYL